MEIAAKAKVKLTNVSPGRLDEIYRLANQSASHTVSVEGVDQLAHPGVTTEMVSDTIGHKFPVSAAGNAYAQTWAIIDHDQRSDHDTGDTGSTNPDHDYYVTFGRDHTATTSIEGLQTFAMQAGVIIAPGVNSGIRLNVDNGGEYGGKFAQHAKDNGINIVTSTAHKNQKTNKMSVAEVNNRDAQVHMRTNLELGYDNFTAFGQDIRLYWDEAMSYGTYQSRMVRAMRSGKVNLKQAQQLTRRGFGARGTVTLHSGSPARKRQQKQMASRSALGLLLGMHGTKCRMLMANGRVVETVDVKFADGCMQPVAGAGVPIPDGHFDGLYDIMTDLIESADAETADMARLLEMTAPATDDVTTSGGATASIGPADSTGVPLQVGDNVVVNWDHYGDQEGIIHAVTESAVEVTYPGDAEPDKIWEHVLSEGSVTKVLLHAKHGAGNPHGAWRPDVTPRRRPFAPHPSVAQYLDERGNILQPVLTGEIVMPSEPALPEFTRADAPAEPRTFRAAMESDLALHILYSALSEMHGHIKPTKRPPTWSQPPRQHRSQPPLRSMWVFTFKFVGSKLNKIKARLVVVGKNLTRGKDYPESHVGTAPKGDLRDLDCYAVMTGMSTYEIDNKQAYCWSKIGEMPNGEPVMMMLPEGTQLYDSDGYASPVQLEMSLYGHPVSGFRWARRLHNVLIRRELEPNDTPCPLNIKQSVAQPLIFYADFNGTKYEGKQMIIWVHNDNLRCYTSSDPAFREFKQWYGNEFEITGGETRLQDQEPQACLGMEVVYEPGSVRHTMPAYIDKLLAEHKMSECNPAKVPMTPGFNVTPDDLPQTDEQRAELVQQVNKLFGTDYVSHKQVLTKYRSLVSGCNWVATMVANTIAVSCSILGRCMHNPCLAAFKQCKQLLRYLKGNRNIGPTYTSDGDPTEWSISSDASFAGCELSRKSQGGFIGGFDNQPPTTWSSTLSKRVCQSTFQAESYHAAEAARELKYKDTWHTEVGIKVNRPHKFYVDNAALALEAAAPIRKWSPRSKHFDIDDKMLTQVVEDRIARVIQIPGYDLAADAMTKPLPNDLLDRFDEKLQGPPRG